MQQLIQIGVAEKKRWVKMMMSLDTFQAAAPSSSSWLVTSASWKGHPIRLRVPYPFQLAEEHFWIPCHEHCVFERLLMKRKVHVKSEGDPSCNLMSFVQRPCCHPLH